MAVALGTIKSAWDVENFVGSMPALKYAFRDLPTLDRAMKLTPGRTICVQAGGCLGVFPKYLAMHFAAVYTFEPGHENFLMLCQNAAESNVVKFQAALGDEHQLIGTSQTRRGSKTHRFPHEGITHISGPGCVPTMRLDDLGLPVCDLLCLDLEGYELFALKGAEQLLKKCRPVLMIEVNDNIEEYGHSATDLRLWLLRHDYEIVERIHSDELYVPMEAAS